LNNLAGDPQHDDVKAWLVPEPNVEIGLSFGVLALCGLRTSMRIRIVLERIWGAWRRQDARRD
jgi:hypothetical protein